MVAQYGLDLAVHIVATHFGDLVAKVCGCLLRRGTLSLDEIVRFSDVPKPTGDGCSPFGPRRSSDPRRETIKKCLLVLIQHNCVQAFSIPKSTKIVGQLKTVTQYMALLENILHRLRFPKFLAIVKQDFGSECEVLLQGLLQNGRLTFDQLLGRALSSVKPKGSSSVRQDLRANFDKLVHAHYVECCPRPEPFIAPDSEEESLFPKRRSAKTREEILSIEKQAMVAAAVSEEERFSRFSDFESENAEMKPVDYLGVPTGTKRKFEALDVDRDAQIAVKENEVLWRVNFEKFMYCLKKKTCAAHVRARLGVESGSLLEAIMESSDHQEATDSNSVTASWDKIVQRVMEKPGGIAMTLDQIRSYLDQLRCNSFTNDTGSWYTIDLKEIIETCQNDEVELHVSAKYGKDACRIFRYLIRTGHPVETDRIADVALVDKKANPEILYKLWKDEFLDMKKVIIPQADRQKYVFTWKVDKTSLWGHFLNDIHHAALNLSLKISQLVEHEIEVRQDIQKFKSVRKVRLMLEASLLKLDEALMLFHDF